MYGPGVTPDRPDRGCGNAAAGRSGDLDLDGRAAPAVGLVAALDDHGADTVGDGDRFVQRPCERLLVGVVVVLEPLGILDLLVYNHPKF